MKNKFQFIISLFASAIIGSLFFLQTSCKKNEGSVDSSQLLFVPSHAIKVEHGMFVFDTKEAFDVTLLEIATAERSKIDQWEAKMGVTSQRHLFNQVIAAEDALEQEYLKMTPKEAEPFLTQPQPHSAFYEEQLKTGIIKIVTDASDGSKYFDYGTCMPSMASLLNADGFVKVQGVIYQYNRWFQKMILDGDFAQLEALSRINRNYSNNQFIVKSYQEVETRADLINNFSTGESAPWNMPESRRRVKFWVLGNSEPVGNLIASNCVGFQTCVFNLRTQAQKKNFWGNWVFSDFYPPFTLSSGTWSYTYHTYPPGVGCGISSIPRSNDIASYSCTGCSSCPCPTSPHSMFVTSTNNAFIPLTPNGTWGNVDLFAKAFDARYTMIGNYAGFPFFVERI